MSNQIMRDEMRRIEGMTVAQMKMRRRRLDEKFWRAKKPLTIERLRWRLKVVESEMTRQAFGGQREGQE